MRILVGIPEKGSQGGPAACEPPFIDELRRLGHNVVEEIYAYAGTNSSLFGRVKRVLDTGRRFRECVRNGNFDIIHINTSLDTKALLRDAVILPRIYGDRAKIFLKFHGSDEQLLVTKNPVLDALCRRLFSHADGIGVLSTEEKINFLRAGVPEQKVFVIKNIVEKNSQHAGSDFLGRHDLPTDKPLLLFIGRFIKAKGLLDVIAACGLLRDKGQSFRLMCLGDGPVRAEAEALSRDLDLQAHVHFFGYIPEAETAEFYANSAVLLFPTYHYEGFPMVIFNAAAAGLPIITTSIRAAADYLKESENCLWVEPRDPDQLAEKIIGLLSDADARKAMSANNRIMAERFSAEKVTREYMDVFEAIVK